MVRWVDENWQTTKKTFRRLSLPHEKEEVLRRKHTKSLFVISRRGEQSRRRRNLINLIIIRRIRLWRESCFSPFSSSSRWKLLVEIVNLNFLVKCWVMQTDSAKDAFGGWWSFLSSWRDENILFASVMKATQISETPLPSWCQQQLRREVELQPK
jgi:hypothetical protein